MKKRKLIGLAALFLALGTAGCGDDPVVDDGGNGGGGGTNPPAECEHEYSGYQSNDEKHWQVCTKCQEETAKRNHSYSKNAARASENKEATCTEDGWEWQICKCGKERKQPINAKGHSYTEVVSTTATCTTAGENTMKCSRCDSVSEEKVAQEALGHDMQDDPTYTEGLAASCTGTGTKRQKCARAGCDHTEIVATPALGHEYTDTAGTPVAGFATLTTGLCSRTSCAGKRVYWAATEVTDECKTNKRKVSDAVEDDPLTEDVNEAAEAVFEPNYLEEGDGVRFWGRPIHNACVLQENGKPASQSAATPVYDATVTGSYFEYKINLAEAMSQVQLIAEIAHTSDLGTGDMFKANSGDWTPGLRDSVDAKYDYRYAIFVDNNELVFDGSDNACPGTTQQWFTFPTNAIDLTAGEHTIRIAMAGGYISTYYAFGFEKVIRGPHEHEYTNDPDHLSKVATCTEAGRRYGVCSCGLVEDITLPALGHDLVNVDAEGNRAATCLNKGVQHKECSRCEYVEDAEIPALGHDFVADGSPIVEDGFATVNPQKCSRDDVYRYVIAGNDVNEATKTAKVITPADPEAGTEAVTQANYVENNDGSVKFNNIPIHNANGGSSRPTEDTYPSLYSPDEEGSFMAYTFKTGVLEDVKIVMDIKPNQYLGNSRKIFSNDLSSDWTPGLKKIGDGDDATYEAYQERFVFELDGQPLELDLDSDYNEIAGSTRRWFTVPLKNQLDFTAGAHTVKIRMGGGYVCDIYNVGVQTQDTEEIIVPPQPVDEGITLNVSSATGYTNKADKMKSNAVFTLGEGEGKVAVEPGEYSVEIMAKMSSGSHSNRKWYNMAKPELCVDGTKEETATSNPDTTDQDDFRYFMMVDNVVYNPESKDSWGTIGLDANNYNKVAFVAKIIVSEVSKTITIAHGNIGYSLYVEGIKLTKIGDHTHDLAVGNKAADSDLRALSCDCGLSGYRLMATDVDAEQGHAIEDTESDTSKRLGKNKNYDVWDVTGIEAGTYAVYIYGKTQNNNQTAYWNAGDQMSHGGTASQNGGAAAGDDAYRYKIYAGGDYVDADAVNVGLADKTYTDAGIDQTGAKWSTVSLANLVVAEGATKVTLRGVGNGFAIWIYGIQLVKVA